MSPVVLVLVALLAGCAAALLVPAQVPLGRARVPPSSASKSAPEPLGLPRFRALLSTTAGLGAVVIVGGTAGLVVGLVVSAVSWQVMTRMEAPAARRRRERLVAGLPHVVDLMTSSLAVGASPAGAIELAAAAVDSPMREELQLVTSRLQLGVDPVRVWSDVGQHAQLGALGRCLARAADTGAPVAEAMGRLGEDLRRNARARIEDKARAVGVKAAGPLGLCLLPAFILTGIVPLVVGSLGAVLRF